MRLLHEDELACIEHLLEHEGQTMNIKYSDIEYSGGYFGKYIVGIHTALGFLLELHKTGLIAIKSSKINWNGFFYDTFLRQYSDLTNKNIEGAKNLAISLGFESLNKTLQEQKSLEETFSIIEEVFKNKDFDVEESDFAKDLYDSINLTVEVRKELREYLGAYLTAYKNDELEKPKSPKEDWAKVQYFEKDFWRYKKQRDVVVELLQRKLDTQNPKLIKIDINKELPLEHINLTELILCLEKEGMIKESKIENIYGNLDRDELGREEFWLVVDEDKVLDQATHKKIKLNLSFASQTGIMTMTDQGAIEYKIKLQGQVQREVLRVIFQNPKDVYSEWTLSNISEILGGNDVDETAVKNAIYQFNKKVKLKIPDIDNLFELTKYSARINPKYINKN